MSEEKRSNLTIFNYIFNLIILIIGLFFVILKINLYLGILYIFQGILIIILVRIVEIQFRKRRKELDEQFEKIKRMLDK